MYKATSKVRAAGFLSAEGSRMWWNDVHKVPSCGKFWSSRDGGMLVRYGEMLERPGAVAFLPRMVPTQQMKAVMSALYCRPLSPTPYPRRSLTAAATPSPRPPSLPPSAPRHLFRFFLFRDLKASSILGHPRYIQAHWRTTKCRDTPPPSLQHAV